MCRALRKFPAFARSRHRPRAQRKFRFYFDTKNRKLHKKGLMLRVRRVGDRYLRTIKSAGHSDLFERDEWESEIHGAMPDLRLAQGTALEPLLI